MPCRSRTRCLQNNDDDELLLDGDLVVHEELVKRKGLSSVKFRTAHLYSLLLDG
jgi:hypothetical protein